MGRSESRRPVVVSTGGKRRAESTAKAGAADVSAAAAAPADVCSPYPYARGGARKGARGRATTRRGAAVGTLRLLLLLLLRCQVLGLRFWIGLAFIAHTKQSISLTRVSRKGLGCTWLITTARRRLVAVAEREGRGRAKWRMGRGVRRGRGG